MPWFKVDDALYSHPKWLAASPAARALWVTAGSWSADQLTDGLVPRHVLPILCARPKDAAELVRVGLWAEEGDGWRFHSWLDFQPSAESVEAERAAARDRMAKVRANKTARSPNVRPNNSRSSEEVRSTRPDPTRPDPQEPIAPTVSERPTVELIDPPAPNGARRRDLLWEAILNAVGADPERVTDSFRGACNKAVADLRRIGATPAEVPGRAQAYHRIYPNTALTPSALAKHWPQLDPAVVDVPQRRNGVSGRSAEVIANARRANGLKERLT